MLKALTTRLAPAWQARPALPAGFAKSLLPLLGLAVLGTALALMLMWRDQASYKPVFGARERVASGEVLAVLEAEHIGYRLHPDTGQVLVAIDAGRRLVQLNIKPSFALLESWIDKMQNPGDAEATPRRRATDRMPGERRAA